MRNLQHDIRRQTSQRCDEMHYIEQLGSIMDSKVETMKRQSKDTCNRRPWKDIGNLVFVLKLVKTVKLPKHSNLSYERIKFEILVRNKSGCAAQ